jgi:6-pyruvoyltetrahydropterin/6-carboxytetrahydropterin synthase
MGKFQSTKLFDGFSTCFRQWRADTTHCKYLHGYGVSFRIWFEGTLDERNWVWDFGGMKRAKGGIDGMNPKAYFDWLLDHTVIVAEDDPFLEDFLKMDKDGIAQVRVVPATGAERFAEFLYNKIQAFIDEETGSRVWIAKLEFYEHGKNSAIYSPEINVRYE